MLNQITNSYKYLINNGYSKKNSIIGILKYYIPVKLKEFSTKEGLHRGYRSDLKLWETKETKYGFTYYKYELFGKKPRLRLFKIKSNNAKYIWTTIKIDEIKWTDSERRWFESK